MNAGTLPFAIPTVGFAIVRFALNRSFFAILSLLGRVMRREQLVIPMATICLVCLAGCREAQVRPGELASVNGQGISFREAEARRVVLFVKRSPNADLQNDAVLQAQYRYVLSGLIEELLVCQYMEKNGYSVSQEVVETEEKKIRADYPEGAFEEMLLEEGIDIERWRYNLRKHLLVESFITQILRPEISIAPDEFQEYYRTHSVDFVLSEQWHFMQIMGQEKSEVERAQGSFLSTRNATAVQKEYLVTIHDILMGKDLLPEALLRELSDISAWQGTSTKNYEGAFRNFVMIEKVPASVLDAATISQRVEQAIAEDKMRLIYANWVREQLDKAKIQLAPALLQGVDGQDPISILFPQVSDNPPSARPASGKAVPAP